MARKKLFRIQEATILPNIVQHDNPDAKILVQEFLKKQKKAFLELGCGRGEYTIGLATLYPKVQCIGVDVQGERMWHGAKEGLMKKMENVLFIRTQIGKLLEFMPEHSIDEIWLPFSDPFPRKKKAKKRLTSPTFLKMYKKILKPGGIIHLKTDNENLFLYTKEIIEMTGAKIMQEDTDVQVTEDEKNPLNIQTQYEKRFRAQGKKIFHVSFTL